MAASGKKSVLTIWAQGVHFFVDLRSEATLRGTVQLEDMHANMLADPSTTIDFSAYDVIYFCASHDFNEVVNGNALGTFVEEGGVLIVTGPCHFLHHCTLKGKMTRMLPMNRSQQVQMGRKINWVHDDFTDIFKDLVGANLNGLHMSGATVKRNDSSMFPVARAECGTTIAAVSKRGKGMILQLNLTANTRQNPHPHGGGLFGNNHGTHCPNSKKILLNTVRFALTTKMLDTKRGEKRKLCLISSGMEEIRFIRIKLGEDMYVGTDAETAMKCGETIRSLIEGDQRASEYWVKIPCTKCASTLAFFLKTATLPESCIEASSFLSLLQAADYLQSDRLMSAIKEYFMNVRNAIKVSKEDVDFRHDKVPFSTFKTIMPSFQSFLEEPNSRWKLVFMRWGEIST